MQAPIQKITDRVMTPLKIGEDRSVGPFVTVAKEDKGYYLHVLFFLHSDVPEDAKIEIGEVEDNSITITVSPDRGRSKSDITSGTQYLWSVLIPPITSEKLSEKYVNVIVDFNEEGLGEPRRGTKVILP